MGSPNNRIGTSRNATFTALQGQYLSFIHAYEGIHGCAPAEADLRRYLGVTPPSVHQMILTLERKGLITRVPGGARSIALRISPAELPPLEGWQQKSTSERERSQPYAVNARQRADRSTRKLPASAAPVRIAKGDPAAEYVDGPTMTHRVRFGRSVAARIAGQYGDYRTEVRVTGKQEDNCTCPSDVWPCKHTRALRATWKANPDSFFDVDGLVRSLASVDKTELIETLRKIVIAFPQALSLFGVAGFDEDGDEDDADDDVMD
jgi:DNA-binding transcriptional regulator YdaS (Cro superfamily)